jgi:hypothetical protein
MQHLPLPDHVYEGLLAFTATQGTTPADWIAAQVLPTPPSLPKPNTATWMPKPESHLSDSATKPCIKR